MRQNIHDKAKAMSLSRGIELHAAYAELAKRATAVKMAKRRKAQLPQPISYRLPYADN